MDLETKDIYSSILSLLSNMVGLDQQGAKRSSNF